MRSHTSRTIRFLMLGAVLASASGCMPTRPTSRGEDPFLSLVQLIRDDALEGVRLDMYDYTGPERRTTVVESQDPEMLERIRMGLGRSFRAVYVTRVGYGVMRDGRLFLRTRAATLTISLSLIGFGVQDGGGDDDRLFYSADLALALDDLYHAKTKRHLHDAVIAGLSLPDWVHQILSERGHRVEDLLLRKKQK